MKEQKRQRRNSAAVTAAHRDQRILILAPTGIDAKLTARFLSEASLSSHVCSTIDEVCKEISHGAGLVFLTEEALSARALGSLARTLLSQPAWSDLPIVLLTSGGSESPANTDALSSLGAIGNVNLIERPVRMMTLLSTLKAALRARNRQYDVRDHLETQVRTKRELEEAFLQVEEASRLRDEFLATVSHELRTPLNAVLGWATLLRTSNLDEAGRERALETIARNARSQQRLIEDLLDVSRAISGKLRIDARRVAPRKFIEEATEALRPEAHARKVRIKQIIENDLGSVLGDPARLRQVVWNLLSNAIKFSNRGGLVVLTARHVDSNLEISVKDRGQGISPEFLPYVFERFRQADMTTTRMHGGLGLGLAIVRQLVELHNGTVTVASSGRGLGATFTVKVPLLAANQSAPAESGELKYEALARHQLNGLKVMVVDDEIDTCDLLKTVLSKQGARVTTAQSAAVALKLISRTKPDLLISDVGMPGTDGYEFMRRIRLLPKERGGAVPAVALTAYAREQDRKRALRAGYQVHLTKPIEVAELSATLVQLIGNGDRANGIRKSARRKKSAR
jgi:signal transduction histidine kinase/AmiR/NasT family two-component response regulator